MTQPILPFATAPSARDLLEAGVRLFGRSLLASLPFATTAVIVGQLPAGYDFIRGELDADLASKDPAWWLLYVSGTLVSLVIWGAIMLRQHAIGAGLRGDAVVELRHAVRRIPGMLLYMLLAALIVLGTMVPPAIVAFLVKPPTSVSNLLFVASLLVAGVLLFFAWPILMIARTSASVSIDTSIRVARAHWRTIVLIVASFVVSAVIFMALAGLTIGLISAFAQTAGQATQTTLVAIAVIFGAALIVLFYSSLLVAGYEGMVVMGRFLPQAAPPDVPAAVDP